MSNSRIIKKGLFELGTFILIIGGFCLGAECINLFQPFFRKGEIFNISIFVLFDSAAIYGVWSMIKYNFIRKQVLSDYLLFFFSPFLSFLVTLNILVLLANILGGMLLLVLYNIGPFIMVIGIYLLIFFWKRYNWQLANQKVLDRELYKSRLFALIALLPTLIFCTAVMIFLLFQLIFS